MTLLKTFFWQTSNYCRTLKRKHFSWSLCLLESESLDCRVVALEKKAQFCKTLAGPGVKMFRKKTCRVKRGKELLLKTKIVLIKICDISHLLACKLPQKFISWVSRKTEMPNCVVFCSTNHRGDSHGSTCTTSNISSIKTYMIFL